MAFPSYDEIVKWRWGIPTWRLRFKIIGGLLLLVFASFMIFNRSGWMRPESKAVPAQRQANLHDSQVNGDIVQGDKVTSQFSQPIMNPQIARKKVKFAIKTSIEDGQAEIERLFREQGAAAQSITSQHASRRTPSSGMYIQDQTNRVAEFKRQCDSVLRRVDRAIESALIEIEGGPTFTDPDWLAEERRLYASLQDLNNKQVEEVESRLPSLPK